MRKRELALGAFLIVFTAASGLIRLPFPEGGDKAVAAGGQLYKNLQLFGDVLEQVRANYVVKTDDAQLIESAIRGVLTGLDPHSSYLSPKEVEEEQAEVKGEFGGLGVDVTMEDGLVKVIAPIDNMPAERAGVSAGDAITAIDGVPVRGLSMDAAVDKMRGPVGSPITLTIVRKGAGKPITVKIVRDAIRINPVTYSVEGDVGWIKVKSFENERTTEFLQQAVEDIKKTLGGNVAGYVLDLRNNPGGLLDQAIALSDAFLERGVIVITKGRNPSDIERAEAKPGDVTGGKPLIVLMNGGSASASEVVAGALQDHKRARVVGTRSFGKGSVQTMISLANKGAIRLTTARYYTPSGRSIQATGIEPDYLVEPELPPDLKLQVAMFPFESEAQLKGHLKNAGAQESGGSISYVPKDKDKDSQLKAAIALLHGQLPETGKAAVDQARAAPSDAAPLAAAGSQGG
ncbi:MAG: S41 family peptidase [Rhodomicrobium sp.]|jgi:carboxyl-terminal processing protease